MWEPWSGTRPAHAVSTWWSKFDKVAVLDTPSYIERQNTSAEAIAPKRVAINRNDRNQKKSALTLYFKRLNYE